MSDPVQGFGEHLWNGMVWLVTFVLTLFGFMAKRQVKRIDEIEKNHVKEAEYNATIGALRREIQEGFRETHRRIDQMLLRDKE